MKKATYINPNKMYIDTGHKTFDAQTNAIVPCAAVCNTQISDYIRPLNEMINPVGEQVAYGYLTQYDINRFKSFGITPQIRNAILKYAETGVTNILYCFFHTINKDIRIVHGFVLTDINHMLLAFWVTGKTQKSRQVIEECIKYISN